MSKKPTFSIIIPIYKVEKFIDKCIQSVINQTFQDFEAICVDDCGNDNSIKILEKYAQKDKRIKIVHHKTNRGLSAARNTGLEKSKGEYIICLDSDDWLEDNCLEIIFFSFKKHKTNSIWFDAYKYDDISQKRLKEPVSGNKKGNITITPLNISCTTDYSWIKAYKASSIKDFNLKWPEGLTFEDGELHFKYFALNPESYIIEDKIYNYRIREGSIVTDSQKGNLKIEHIYQVVKNLKNFCIKHDIYEKYKYGLLMLINSRINTCKSITNHYQKSIHLSKDLLEYFNFPEDFKEIDLGSNPIFSVIVPIYNVEKYMEKCIRSIQAQKFTQFEIICVDDCGSDSSIEIVKKFAQEDKRIKIIQHEKNKGLGGARNTGLKNAKGKYVLFVDSDDWLHADCLGMVFNKFLETNLNTIWFKANIWWENLNKLTDMCIFPHYAEYPEGFLQLDENNLIDFPLYSWNKAYNRNFLIKNNLYWPENIIFEDVEFYFKTFIKDSEIYIINTPLYFYRRRDNSIISSCIENSNNAKALFEVVKNVYKFLQENGYWEKYQKAFYQYVKDTVIMFKAYPEIQKELLPYINDMLNEII